MQESHYYFFSMQNLKLMGSGVSDHHHPHYSRSHRLVLVRLLECQQQPEVTQVKMKERISWVVTHLVPVVVTQLVVVVVVVVWVK